MTPLLPPRPSLTDSRSTPARCISTGDRRRSTVKEVGFRTQYSGTAACILLCALNVLGIRKGVVRDCGRNVGSLFHSLLHLFGTGQVCGGPSQVHRSAVCASRLEGSMFRPALLLYNIARNVSKSF